MQVPTSLINDWERPSRRQLPDPAQLERLSQLVGLPPQRLRPMFPSSNVHLQTRLCPTCYAAVGVHCVTWQQKGIERCDRHNLPLLTACPACQTGFRTPALWSESGCERCGLPFNQMQSQSNTSSQI